MCVGTFTPSPDAARLTRAPHAGRPSTPSEDEPSGVVFDSANGRC
jgi:hypothetical protein